MPNVIAPAKSGGYVLLAMLAVLLGVGGGWMATTVSVGGGPASPMLLNAHARQSLVDARQALVSYSVLYPFMYGPAGAGPGHFPCPDTDGFTHYGATTASASDQRRDGPNPPCSAWAGSAGHLPRHVVLPAHRYLFHAHSRQHYVYHVAGDVVNNPLNRIVNLSDVLVRGSTPAAEIRIPASDAETETARVVITGNSLVEAVAASVAAWVIQRSTHNVTLPVESQEACDENGIVRLLLDDPITLDGQCIEDSLAMNSIEGVPALRHWFVRNQWNTVVQIQASDACEAFVSTSSLCRLVLPLVNRKSVPESGLITLLLSQAS